MSNTSLDHYPSHLRTKHILIGLVDLLVKQRNTAALEHMYETTIEMLFAKVDIPGLSWIDMSHYISTAILEIEKGTPSQQIFAMYHRTALEDDNSKASKPKAVDRAL